MKVAQVALGPEHGDDADQYPPFTRTLFGRLGEPVASRFKGSADDALTANYQRRSSIMRKGRRSTPRIPASLCPDHEQRPRVENHQHQAASPPSGSGVVPRQT